MLEIIQQNPLVSLVLVIIPAIAAAWKIFDALYVKPRDFRISVLEKNLDELKKELQRPEQIQLTPQRTNNEFKSEPKSPILQADSVQKIEALSQSTTLLNDMVSFCKSWKDPALTELQRSHFEKSYTGQKILWRARLGDVTEEKDGLLWTSLMPESEPTHAAHVVAVFDSKHKEALLILRKNDVVTVSGIIDRFFLSPLIRDCTISRGV
ncbi:hypothetical protein [Stutzerimonas zhaodongensis]|jgi:hypothetical protein|uniref:Uncharacterized protein n=1 Tax=Stutzerimonas zhaodongensis TaxID=1176257 RepID=A0A365PVQ0_9GAMM|nr:hypothetical protein [Stutzerimonas zhaodongensis]QWV18831.1 hypothetical protein KQ248_09385 [Stutzerimonas zhaodongensis]RBA59457.1 hypothetical protein DQ403_09310 [Stutzerimonas zhaodongensis]